MFRRLYMVLALAGFLQVGAQKSPAPFATGDMLHETLKFTDTSGRAHSLRIPCDTAFLFYRYRGQNWLHDNLDSVKLVEKIMQDLNRSSGNLKHLRLICYSYNADHFLNAANRPHIGNGSYRTEYLYLNERTSSRLLNNGKLLLVSTKGKVLTSSHYLGSYSYVHKDDQRVLKGKLLTEKNGKKVPLANAKVELKSGSELTASSSTDKYGDFQISVPDNGHEHSLRVEPMQTVETVILASQEGIERARFIRNGNGFEYKLIESDVVRLSEQFVEEDIGQELSKFLSTKDREFRRSEFINYPSGSYMIEEDSKPILDRVAILLNENQSLRLEVISHTDAQGEDQSNLLLSEKRSFSVVSYLILIGVHKDRLTYTGKGEKEIRNRCRNGVDCSDIEHRYNRRTEFRFVREGEGN